jgi:hypothetical protein
MMIMIPKEDVRTYHGIWSNHIENMDYPYGIRNMDMEMDMDSYAVNQTEGSYYHIIPTSRYFNVQ